MLTELKCSNRPFLGLRGQRPFLILFLALTALLSVGFALVALQRHGVRSLSLRRRPHAEHLTGNRRDEPRSDTSSGRGDGRRGGKEVRGRKETEETEEGPAPAAAGVLQVGPAQRGTQGEMEPPVHSPSLSPTGAARSAQSSTTEHVDRLAIMRQRVEAPATSSGMGDGRRDGKERGGLKENLRQRVEAPAGDAGQRSAPHTQQHEPAAQVELTPSTIGKQCRCACRRAAQLAHSAVPCQRSDLCASRPLKINIGTDAPAGWGDGAVACPTDELVMHCPSDRGGEFVLRAGASGVVALLRISGPVVDTVLFHAENKGRDNMQMHADANRSKEGAAACRLWTAGYSICGPGRHFATVYRLFDDASVEAVMSGKTCLRRAFSDHFLRFSWRQEGAVSGAGVAENCFKYWHWPNFTSAGYARQVEALSYIKNVKYLKKIKTASTSTGLGALTLNDESGSTGAWHDLRGPSYPSSSSYSRAAPSMAHRHGGQDLANVTAIDANRHHVSMDELVPPAIAIENRSRWLSPDEDRGRSELLLLEDRCLRCGNGLCGGVLAAGLLVGVAACLRGRALESVTACLRGREPSFAGSIIISHANDVCGANLGESSANKCWGRKAHVSSENEARKTQRFDWKCRNGAKNGVPARRSKSTAAEASLPR